MKRQISQNQTIFDFSRQYLGRTDPKAVWAIIVANPEVFFFSLVFPIASGTWIEIPDSLIVDKTPAVLYASGTPPGSGLFGDKRGNGPGYGMSLIGLGVPNVLPPVIIGFNWDWAFLGTNTGIHSIDLTGCSINQKIRLRATNITGVPITLTSAHYGGGAKTPSVPAFIGVETNGIYTQADAAIYDPATGQFFTVQTNDNVYFDFIFTDQTQLNNGFTLQVAAGNKSFAVSIVGTLKP